MRWQEIYEILKTYDDENRKGWYSYTWANHGVSIMRKSDPNKIYHLDLFKWGHPADEATVETLKVGEDGKLVWDWVASDTMKFSELPDADDYVVADPIFHPYIGMVRIKKINSPVEDNDLIHKDLMYVRAIKVNEQRLNFMTLNGIKKFINKWDDYFYSRRWYGCDNKDDVPSEEITDCAWCGNSTNEYSAAEFHFNYNEYHIATSGYINRENKHRRHFKEQEWLFPWISNGWERDECLYIQTSSLWMWADKKALKEHKDKIIADIGILMKEAGVEEYDLVEIRKPFKYFAL